MLNNRQTTMDELDQLASRVREAVLAKRDYLRGLLNLRQWRAVDGEVPPAQAPELQAEWETISTPHDWLAKDTARTMYHELRLPTEFAGISLLGQRVELLFCSLIGTTLYADNKQLYSADYWADTQVVPVELHPDLQAELRLDLVLHMRQGNGFGLLITTYLSIDAIDDWIFRLDTFAEEIAFSLFLARNNPAAPWLVAALHDALASFNLAALEQDDWDSVTAAISAAQAKLAGFEEQAKQYKVSLIGHSHIDMNWLWPSWETVELVRRDFESVDGILTEFPQVRFSHSQAATYKMMQDHYPELLARVKSRIAAGQWEVNAATWVEGDLNMGGYESLARQLLHGKQYSREELGADPELCWEPDTFGHPATMPQLLRQAGVKYYYHTRASKGESVFWWEGLDGSRVLVFNDPRGYLGQIYASDIMPVVTRLEGAYGLKRSMYVYGFGDHGGGVTRRDVRRGIRLDESKLLPRFEFSKATDFYRDVAASGLSFPVIRGELNTVFEGCYTSHGDIKLANRATEHALGEAETLAAIAAISNPGAAAIDTTALLLEAWRTQLFNQFHDIVCGCAVGSTYTEAVAASAGAKAVADDVTATALRRVVTTGDGSGTITVFNTLGWPRTDVVLLCDSDHPEIAAWQGGDWLADAAGGRTVLQRCDEGILFSAHDIPALGYKTYSYQGGAGGGETQCAVAFSPVGNPVLDNGRFRVEIDKDSGTIVSLIDLSIKRELSYTPQNLWVESNRNKGLLNLFEVQYEAPHTMSAWKIGTITAAKRLVAGAVVTVGAEGPVMQSVRVEHHVASSTIRQEIRTYTDTDRIDFVTTVDWQGEGSVSADAPMLRVLFMPKLKSAQATFDVPFGAIERESDGQEVPAIHWVDVSEQDAAYGLSVLNNAKYGYSVQGNIVALSLIRSSYEPDTRPDVGEHSFTYSILPHHGDWREGCTVQHAWELNRPVRAISGAAAGSEFGTLQIEEQIRGAWQPAEGLLISSLRPISSGTTVEVILRLVEMTGRKAAARLVAAAPVLAAEEANLLNEHVRSLAVSEGSVIDLGYLQPWEVRTVHIQFAAATS